MITYVYISAGLRKLEAFFGFLITIMALSFGYEVRFGHLKHLSPSVWLHHRVDSVFSPCSMCW